MSFIDIFMDMLPDGWFDGVRDNYGETLTDQMIIESVQQSSEFFNIENPISICDDYTTGVYTNLNVTPMDDILIVNRDQLTEMGITERDGLDLVMTHEGAHRKLQGIDTGYNSHQEELCCDFMSGVRAGLNGMDISQMAESLEDSPESDSHPAGDLRVASIEQGVQFAQTYLKEHNIAPTFSECRAGFNETVLGGFAAFVGEQVNLRPEDSEIPQVNLQQEIQNNRMAAFQDVELQESYIRHYQSIIDEKELAGHPHELEDQQLADAITHCDEAKGIASYWDNMTVEEYNNLKEASGETIGSAAYVDNGAENSLKGYTQAEIRSKMSKAEHEMACQESNMRHRESMMKSKARMGEPYSYEEYQYNVAKRKYEEARAEYNKWRYTKPDAPKGFVNDCDWHIKEAQRALDRGDIGSYNDHMSSAKMSSR